MRCFAVLNAVDHDTARSCGLHRVLHRITSRHHAKPVFGFRVTVMESAPYGISQP